MSIFVMRSFLPLLVGLVSVAWLKGETPVVSSSVGRESKDFPRFKVHLIDAIGWKMGHTALADVDRDGDLDWIAGESPWETERRAWWWEYRGPDTWVRHDIGRSDSDVGGTAGDVNEDGWPDYWAGAILFLNRQDGAFSRHEVGTIFSHDSEFADIDGDGRLDGLANRDKYGLFWYEIPSDPTEPWISHRIIDAADYKIHAAVSPRATGDLDGDGDIDIVYAGAWIENLDGRGLKWALHRNIDFGEACVYGIGVKTWVCDLDGDGDLDFVQSEADNPDGRVAWFENDGKARWTRHLIKDKGDRQDWHSLVVADFDNDGDLDVFSGGGPLSDEKHLCYIWENTEGTDGNPGSVGWIEHLVADKPCHEAVGGDVDGDGDIDICTKPWDSGSEHLFFENRLIEGPAGED